MMSCDTCMLCVLLWCVHSVLLLLLLFFVFVFVFVVVLVLVLVLVFVLVPGLVLDCFGIAVYWLLFIVCS